MSEEDSDDESKASGKSSDSEDESGVESDAEYRTLKKTHHAKKTSPRMENWNKEVLELKVVGEGPPKVDISIQLNIDDLTECFWCLEMKVAETMATLKERGESCSGPWVCYMCGFMGHRMKDCHESKFFLNQGICRLDVNGQVVMSDGLPFPWAVGEGGSARVIKEHLALGPRMSSSASNIEVESYQVEYEEDVEFATLGSMAFEVLPVE